jgi:hypothetical protein
MSSLIPKPAFSIRALLLRKSSELQQNQLHITVIYLDEPTQEKNCLFISWISQNLFSACVANDDSERPIRALEFLKEAEYILSEEMQCTLWSEDVATFEIIPT